MPTCCDQNSPQTPLAQTGLNIEVKGHFIFYHGITSGNSDDCVTQEVKNDQPVMSKHWQKT